MTSSLPEARPGYPHDPYDAVLLLSFGGPEQPGEVLPFLQNVTRGRGVPPERLPAVAEHYQHFGGRSPINDQNRALLAALRAQFDAVGCSELPLYWGNRNWDPFVTDTLRQAHRDGVRRVLVIVTSAYSSYSGCRQYREDLADALATLASEGRYLRVDKIRHYYNHPGFIAATVDAVLAGAATLRRDHPDVVSPRLLFVTHSVPSAMNGASGPDGGQYLAQHREAAQLVTAAVNEALVTVPDSTPASALGRAPGERLGAEVVYCSRSGAPNQPWLEPDINDRLLELQRAGTRGVIVVPIGFVSDHMEVIYDLDTEARETADTLGLPMIRVATVGTDPRFVAGLADLVLERAASERGEPVTRAVTGSGVPWPDRCPAGCCANLRAPQRSAACGADAPAEPAELAELLERDPAEVAALRVLARDAARRAGALIRTDRPLTVQVTETKSSPTDVVTAMDRAAEDLLRQILLTARPDDGLLGEEGGWQPGSSGLTWVLDPIDGTVNYLYGLPSYAVSVAVVIGDPRRPGAWRPIAGCVHNPVTGQTWTAGTGQGAELDDVPLVVSAPVELSQALVATGFGYRAERRRWQAAVLAGLLPRIRDIRRVGSASLDLCLVATGQFDAYYERGLSPWDMAAAMLVAQESGVSVRGLAGRPPGEDMVIAAASPLITALAAELETLTGQVPPE